MAGVALTSVRPSTRWQTVAAHRVPGDNRGMHYLLFYDVVTDYAERRKPLRAVHLEHAEAALARGELVLAGALAEPLDGAVFLFKGDDASAAEAFAKADPYVRNGLVPRWWIRKWPTVIGHDAATPLASASFR
jgi:uncharacterized protein YciI